MEHAPEVEAGLRQVQDERETPRAVAKPPQKKKNKPMSKSEQERKIEHLTRVQREFQQKQGSGSQEPVPSTHTFSILGYTD
jgi:bromodomain-containing factor 1